MHPEWELDRKIFKESSKFDKKPNTSYVLLDFCDLSHTSD